MGGVALTLIAGPANAEKVARLLERYLDALDRDPVLIVPNRPDVDRVERELLEQAPVLLGGTIGTFDDVFRSIVQPPAGRLAVATDVQRALVVRRAVAARLAERPRALGALRGLRRRARRGRLRARGRARLAGGRRRRPGLALPAYRAELDGSALGPRRLRAEAVGGSTNDIDAWRRPAGVRVRLRGSHRGRVALLEAIAGRAEVTVSLPYEPGRAAFAVLQETAGDLSRLADGSIEELAPAFAEVAHPAIAIWSACSSTATPPPPPPLEGCRSVLRGRGPRGVLELVGDEILELVRGGTSPEQIGVVVPAIERWRAPVETAFGALGIPVRAGGTLAAARHGVRARAPRAAALRLAGR